MQSLKQVKTLPKIKHLWDSLNYLGILFIYKVLNPWRVYFIKSYNSYEIPHINRYIDRLTASLSGQAASVSTETAEWIQKIENWNPKIFTLAHTPPKYRNFISKFIRRVIIARMSEFPDLASMYHIKLREAYETEDKLKNQDAVKQSEDELCAILDEAELQLEKTMYLAGEEFTLADSMFIPLLVRLSLLELEEQYINTRPNVLAYYNMVKKRPSYKIVIGKYFDGWRKYCTLYKTVCFLLVRKTLRRYWLWACDVYVWQARRYIRIRYGI